MSHVLVIGAGFAGLAGATALAARGHRVTIVEAGREAGGEARRVEAAEASVDIGPTILTDLRPLRAVASTAGVALDDIIAIEALDPGLSVTFPDGVSLAIHRDPRRMAEALRSLGPDAERDWASFLDLGARALRLAEHYWAHGDVAGPRDLGRFLVAGAPALGDLAPFLRFGSLASLLARRVRTPRLRALLGHFARFVGLGADRAPAVTICIPYLLVTSGVWYARGGMSALALALLALATKLGATLETDARVERLEVHRGRVVAVMTSSGRRLAADAVVAAVDAAVAAEWLPAPRRRPGRLDPALAARVAWWVVEGDPPRRIHHTLHFQTPGGEPLYVATPTVTDPSLAPPGASVLYGLVHGPVGAVADAAFADAVRKGMERAGQWPGGRILASGVVGGRRSSYGYMIGPGLLASFRPSQRVPGLSNLVRAGASVFPGPGVANVIRSGLRAAALVDGEARR